MTYFWVVKRDGVSRDRHRLFSLVDLEVRHRGNMAPTLVEHVVADAGAFLKKAPLQVKFYLFGFCYIVCTSFNCALV